MTTKTESGLAELSFPVGPPDQYCQVFLSPYHTDDDIFSSVAHTLGYFNERKAVAVKGDEINAVLFMWKPDP